MMNIFFLTIKQKYFKRNLLSVIFILFGCANIFSQDANILSVADKKYIYPLYSSYCLEYSEIRAYKSSFLGDNMLSILKINPEQFDFRLICASQNDLIKSANEWIDTLNLNIIFNAGMYNLKDNISHQFYLKNFEHVNNSCLSSNANGIIAFNPSVDSILKLQLFDLSMDDWAEINKSYQSIVQGQRMIDCNGNPVFWNNRVQFCSMLVLAQDKSDNIYLIFSRSPFTQNQMIENLLNLPFQLINAIYLEGGSRANFVISTKEFNIKKVGSFVTDYNPNDRNQRFFPFPNFIGVTQIGL
jgi:hypothetical protein